MRYQLDDFLQVGKLLGAGSYGHVAKVMHKKTSEIFAMKVVPKQKVLEHDMTAYLAREVKTQMGLQHPHILKLYYYFEDQESVRLLLEFASEGSLFQRLKARHKLPEPEGARIFTDVADALIFLHSHDIVHRDLKPENILMCAHDVAKLADFGWCAELKKGMEERNTFCGTVEYLSPEMVEGGAHDYKIDVWAMGVLLYEMLCGRSPFASKNPSKTFERIIRLEMSIPEYISQDANDLIRKLLMKEPTERISLVDAVKHRWSLKRVEFEREDVQKSVVSSPVTAKSVETMLDITNILNSAQPSQSSPSYESGGGGGDQLGVTMLSPSSVCSGATSAGGGELLDDTMPCHTLEISSPTAGGPDTSGTATLAASRGRATPTVGADGDNMVSSKDGGLGGRQRRPEAVFAMQTTSPYRKDRPTSPTSTTSHQQSEAATTVPTHGTLRSQDSPDLSPTLPSAASNLLEGFSFSPPTRLAEERSERPAREDEASGAADPKLTEHRLRAATSVFLGSFASSEGERDLDSSGDASRKAKLLECISPKGVRFKEEKGNPRGAGAIHHLQQHRPAPLLEPPRQRRAHPNPDELDSSLNSSMSSASSPTQPRLAGLAGPLLPGLEPTSPSARTALKSLRHKLRQRAKQLEVERHAELETLEREQEVLKQEEQELQAERIQTRRRLHTEQAMIAGGGNSTPAVLMAAAASLAASEQAGSPRQLPEGNVGTTSSLGTFEDVRLFESGGSSPVQTFEDVRAWVLSRRAGGHSPGTGSTSTSGTQTGSLTSPISTAGHLVVPGSEAAAEPRPRTDMSEVGAPRLSWSSPSPRVFCTSSPGPRGASDVNDSDALCRTIPCIHEQPVKAGSTQLLSVCPLDAGGDRRHRPKTLSSFEFDLDADLPSRLDCGVRR